MQANYSNIFDKGMNYPEYRALISTLLLEGKTTGEDNSEAMLHYTKMNNQRMNRVEKTTVFTDELTAVIAGITNPHQLLVISEGWCGDAAQILPIIAKIASAAPEKFDLKIVLRDKNLALMDQHLTNGGRAIPVLLVLNAQGDLLLPKWGPRPAVLQDLISEWRNETDDKFLLAEKLHAWYAKDKTLSTQQELVEVFKQLI